MVDIQDGLVRLLLLLPLQVLLFHLRKQTSRTYISFGNDPLTPNNLLNTDTWQFNDNLTAYLGKHTLTAGVSFEHDIYKWFTALINGIYTFNNLNDFYTAANAFIASPSRLSALFS